MPIRVLHILTGLYSGGVQTVVMNYAKAIRKYDIIFDYVVQKDGNPQIETECRAQGQKIYRLPDVARSPVAFVLALYRLLRSHPEYQIVHAHQNDLNSILMLGARLGARICISHSHSARTQPTGIKGALKRGNRFFLCRIAGQRWACSVEAYRWLYGTEFDPQSSQDRIFRNAIPLERYAFDRKMREQVRAELGVREQFVLGCVATLSHNKNQAFLLDVLACMPAQERVCYKLMLIGSGPTESALKAKAAEKNVREQVLFLGDRRDVPRLLQAMDCFALPSFFEGVPVGVLEAQASGLPCLLSNGVPNAVDILPSVYREKVEKEDCAIWAERLRQLRARPHKRENPGRLFAEAGYDLDLEAEKLARFYESVSI